MQAIHTLHAQPDSWGDLEIKVRHAGYRSSLTGFTLRDFLFAALGRDPSDGDSFVLTILFADPDIEAVNLTLRAEGPNFVVVRTKTTTISGTVLFWGQFLSRCCSGDNYKLSQIGNVIVRSAALKPYLVSVTCKQRAGHIRLYSLEEIMSADADIAADMEYFLGFIPESSRHGLFAHTTDQLCSWLTVTDLITEGLRPALWQYNRLEAFAGEVPPSSVLLLAGSDASNELSSHSFHENRDHTELGKTVTAASRVENENKIDYNNSDSLIDGLTGDIRRAFCLGLGIDPDSYLPMEPVPLDEAEAKALAEIFAVIGRESYLNPPRREFMYNESLDEDSSSYSSGSRPVLLTLDHPG